MRFILIILISIFLSNQSFAKTGKGELKLDKDTMEHLIMYMYGAGNKKYLGVRNVHTNQQYFLFLKTVHGHTIHIVQLNIMMDVFHLIYLNLKNYVKKVHGVVHVLC